MDGSEEMSSEIFTASTQKGHATIFQFFFVFAQVLKNPEKILKKINSEKRDSKKWSPKSWSPKKGILTKWILKTGIPKK